MIRLLLLDRNEADSFYKFINEVDPNIKFTQEECVDNKLAFLDCQVHIHEDGSLKSTVYRKPTHTDFYLQFDSHHPRIHKLGVIRSLQLRASTIISDQEDLPGEQNHIQKSLGCCGYPNWAFTKAKKKRAHTESKRRNGQRIKNTLKSFGIATSYKPTNIIRGKLVHVKDKPPKDKQSNLVYGITCAATDCGEAYVGETKQSLRARINQHRRPSSSEAQKSAGFNHCKTSDHFFKPEEVVILDKEDKWFERGVREAIWERVEQPAINKKGGLRFQLPHAWDQALQNLPRQYAQWASGLQSSLGFRCHIWGLRSLSGL
ncbi:uncharacterized protein [Amphiura filiformis]|uniref:uncharacterized protein n=1 Tax=Amphiura filiformis TaxID=82378 RepID=UPI003B2284A0